MNKIFDIYYFSEEDDKKENITEKFLELFYSNFKIKLTKNSIQKIKENFNKIKDNKIFIKKNKKEFIFDMNVYNPKYFIEINEKNVNNIVNKNLILNFNISSIKIMDEYFDHFDIFDIKIYFDKKFNKNIINKNNIYFFTSNYNFFKKKYFYDILSQNICNNNTFVFNFEQLTRKYIKEAVDKYIETGINIIDYSLSNIELNKKLIYIPYQIDDNVITELKNINDSYEYDVCLMSINSEYRQKMYDKLKENDINVKIVNCYGIQRDNIIKKSKILLNLHFNEEYNIFEHLRCDRWIFSKKNIVSEKSFMSDILDIKPFIYECKNINEIIITIKDILNKNKNIDINNKLITNDQYIMIKNDRKKHLDNFLQKLEK